MAIDRGRCLTGGDVFSGERASSCPASRRSAHCSPVRKVTSLRTRSISSAGYNCDQVAAGAVTEAEGAVGQHGVVGGTGSDLVLLQHVPSPPLAGKRPFASMAMESSPTSWGSCFPAAAGHEAGGDSCYASVLVSPAKLLACSAPGPAGPPSRRSCDILPTAGPGLAIGTAFPMLHASTKAHPPPAPISPWSPAQPASAVPGPGVARPPLVACVTGQMCPSASSTQGQASRFTLAIQRMIAQDAAAAANGRPRTSALRRLFPEQPPVPPTELPAITACSTWKAAGSPAAPMASCPMLTSPLTLRPADHWDLWDAPVECPAPSPAAPGRLGACVLAPQPSAPAILQLAGSRPHAPPLAPQALTTAHVRRCISAVGNPAPPQPQRPAPWQ